MTRLMMSVTVAPVRTTRWAPGDCWPYGMTAVAWPQAAQWALPANAPRRQQFTLQQADSPGWAIRRGEVMAESFVTVRGDDFQQ
jgi:hypothetical protein